jgi:pyruvate/2-oxoglutarate dehydrogenase complex dihydrolipoamide dehydrogenase (E3) component
MIQKYDVIVIGAGSGGLVAATSAKRKGYKVALLEKNKIGGECTHYGCVPSKALLNAAKMFEATKHLSEKYGIAEITVSGTLDFESVMEGVDKIVQKIYSHETPDVFEKLGIDVFVDKSGASFIDSHTVQIGNDILKFDYAIICTGSSPVKIDIPGSSEMEFLHNENFWNIRELPKSIVFIGGGVISAEIGQALTRFGSKVSILDNNDTILKVLDKEVITVIRKSLEKEGASIITNANLKEFKKGKGKKIVVFEQNNKIVEIETDSIFIAAGRKPNIKGLNLENASIDYDNKAIHTNSFLQTSSPHIYSCGDVTSTAKFTHTASHQAEIVIKNIIENNVKENDLSILPWAIFTEPEIAHVGLSEKQARDKFGDSIQVFKVDATIDRFMTDRNEIGFLKVIFDKDNLVIGADAIGAHAGEWIQLLTLAIKNKISAESMADTIFAYPTYSEIVKKVFTRFLRTKK